MRLTSILSDEQIDFPKQRFILKLVLASPRLSPLGDQGRRERGLTFCITIPPCRSRILLLNKKSQKKNSSEQKNFAVT